jgi:hypothetical protein
MIESTGDIMLQERRLRGDLEVNVNLAILAICVCPNSSRGSTSLWTDNRRVGDGNPGLGWNLIINELYVIVD